MSNDRIIAVLAICGITVAGTGLMTENMNKLRKEDNAFAKDCNDRGGYAEFRSSARQCIGARPKETEKGGA